MFIKSENMEDCIRKMDVHKSQEMMKVTKYQQLSFQDMYKVNSFNNPTLKLG